MLMGRAPHQRGVARERPHASQATDVVKDVQEGAQPAVIAGDAHAIIAGTSEKLDHLKMENEQLRLKKEQLVKELQTQDLEEENEKLKMETAALREAVKAKFGNHSVAAAEAEAAAEQVV